MVWSIFRVPLEVRKCKEKYWFWGNGPVSGKLNFKFVFNSKTDFSGSQKRKKLHFDTKFHMFWSTWELKTIILQTFRTFQVVKIFFPRSGGS